MLIGDVGTGTAVGDPLEVEALSKVMSPGRTEPLIIGAVKASIGHCEAASGIAAVMKAVLAVESGVIPPTYGFTNPNPNSKYHPKLHHMQYLTGLIILML